MADDRYDYYRSNDDRDRDVYLDNRSGVGAPRGRGYRASSPGYGSGRGYGRAYGEDDSRDRDRERGYSSYGNRPESRSFRPEDYRADYGQGSYSDDAYGARDYQSGNISHPETYDAYAGRSRAGQSWDSNRDFDRSYFAGGSGYGPGYGPEDERGRARYEGEGRQRDHGPGGRDHRGFWDRAGDTVASWLGDDEARRRHEADQRASHRGKGPKGYKRADDRIREDVNERLTDDLWLDASHIEVTVKDSEITLTGTVASRDDRRYAERIAESVSGSTHVQNNLRVDTGAATASASGSSAVSTGEDDVLARQAAGKH